ncbi:unnamed protein product [Lathyrus sativus]|nr:unnamed protein product [Lathyrus sativus]
MEKKLARSVEEIIYRHPTLNEDDCIIFYIMTPIRNDEDVEEMFWCHMMFGQLPTIELYVRLLDNPETFPTQETQSHWYGMSQTSDDEPTQNNLPFIPNEEVGEASDDDIQEVRMQDIFRDSDDKDNEDIVVASMQLIRAQPISLYNPPAHMQNIGFEQDDTTFVFGSAIPNHIGEEIEISMETSLRKRNSTWVIGKLSGSHTCTTMSMAQDHRKLSSEMVSHSIRELVNSDASLKVKVIIAHILEKYGYIISYRKAWIAKCKAVESLYGNWETSYNDLP